MTFAAKAKGSSQNLPETTTLEDLRTEIDRVDQQLFALLKERAELVFSVGEYKRARQMPIYDPEREGRIRQKVRQAAGDQGPLSPSEMESLFMALVERYRFMEGAHVQRSLMESVLSKTHLDLTQSQTVVICGFGLLGASFYLALNEALPHWRFEVLDPGISLASFLQWKEEKGFTNLHFANADHMHPAGVYVLAASVEINAQYLSEFEFPKGALVLDLGSTKASMLKAYQQRKDKTFAFVGGHPLAGKEVSGYQNADAMLFYNKVFCWTASRDVSENIKSTCEALALALGAKPFWTTAEEHDEALAWTSHVPQILSSVLATCLKDKSFANQPEFFPGVISDLLRISGSSFSMWESILKTNETSLQKALSEILVTLEACSQDSAAGLPAQKLFQESNQFYKQFQILKQKKGGS